MKINEQRHADKKGREEMGRGKSKDMVAFAAEFVWRRENEA